MAPERQHPESSPRPVLNGLLRMGRVTRNGLLVLGVAAALLVFGLVHSGLPDGLTRRIVAQLNTGDYAVELDRITLDLPAGVAASAVRVYRKGVVAPPVFEAESVRLGVDPLVWRWGAGTWFRDVDIRRGTIRRPEAPGPKAMPGGAGGSAAASRPPLSVTCRLHDVEVFGVWVEHGSADVHWDSRTLRVTEFAATIGRDGGRGTVAGGFTLTGDEWRARVTLAVDPHVLLPAMRVFGVGQSRVYEWFSFPSTPPTCELTIERKAGSAPSLQVRGRLQATQFAYRGTAIGFGTLSGAYAWSSAAETLALSPVVLVVGGRNISGTLGVDLTAETVQVEAVSLADIPALARLAGIREGSFLDAFQFGRDTRVYVKGRIAYGAVDTSDAEIQVDSPSVVCRGLTAEDCAFKVRMAGSTNILQDLRGRIAGGSFTANGVFTAGARESTNADYQVKAEVLHADVRQLLSAFNTNAPAQIDGRVYGNIELAGRAGAGQGATAVGQGYLNIKRGTLYRIPLFGGFTEAMARVVPGVDFVTRQTDVRAPFEVSGGWIRSRDIQIEGDVLSHTGRGSASLDGKLDVDVQVRPMKDKTLIGTAARVIASPFSKLFEFHLQGTVDAPRWSSSTLETLSGQRRRD